MIKRLLASLLDTLKKSPEFGIPFLLFIVLTPFLGIHPIFGSTEARECQVVASILRNNEWILPLRNGIIPSKPVFFHWLGALSSTFFGEVSPFSVRLVSVFGGVIFLYVSILIAYAFQDALRKKSGEDYDQLTMKIQGHGGQMQSLPVLVGCILITSYIFLSLAIDARVDMLFSALNLCALASLLIPFLSEYPFCIVKTKHFLLFLLFCLLGVLTKGPLGIVLPLLLVVTACLYLYGIKTAFKVFIAPWKIWILFIGVVLIWYILAYMKGGEAFLERQIYFENVKRVFGDAKMNTEKWWFYLPSILRTHFPWSIFFTVFLIREFINSIKERIASNEIFERRNAVSFQKVKHLPFVIYAAGVVFFSVVSGKRHSYLLPLLPFFALTTALYIQSYKESLAFKKKIILGNLTDYGYLGSIFLLLFFVFVLDRAKHPFPIYDIETAETIYWIGAVANMYLWVLGGALVLLFAGLTLTHSQKLLVMMSASVLILSFGITLGYGVKGHLKSFDVITERLKAQIDSGGRTAFLKDEYDEYMDPIFFYMKREVTVKQFSEQILYDICPGKIVIQLKDLKKLEAITNEFIMFEPIGYYSERVEKDKNSKNKLLLFSCTFNTKLKKRENRRQETIIAA
jgi:4-amino-4-deoxy-L-arabinose transferase-like glycosyltransferase